MTANPLGLSNDAYATLSSFWLTMLCTDLVFRTPSRIHPRAAVALAELETAGLITKEVEHMAGPGVETWTYRPVREKTIGRIKPMSQKRIHADPMPITKD